MMNSTLNALIFITYFYTTTGIIYTTPQQISYNRQYNVLDLGNRSHLLNDIIRTCQTKFSKIFMDLEVHGKGQVHMLDNFEYILSIIPEQTSLQLFLTFGTKCSIDSSESFEDVNLQWKHDVEHFTAFLEESESIILKLKRKNVKGISIRYPHAFCVFVHSQSVVSVVVKLRSILLRHNMSLGFEIHSSQNLLVSSNLVYPCTSNQAHSLVKNSDFLVLHVEEGHTLYTYSDFSTHLENRIEKDLGLIEISKLKPEIIVKVSVTGVADLIQRGRSMINHPSVFLRYKKLTAYHLYRLGSISKRQVMFTIFDNSSVLEWFKTERIRFRAIVLNEIFETPEVRKRGLEIITRKFDTIFLPYYKNGVRKETIMQLKALQAINEERVAFGLPKVSIILSFTITNKLERNSTFIWNQLAKSNILHNSSVHNVIGVLVEIDSPFCVNLSKQPFVAEYPYWKSIKKMLSLNGITLGFDDRCKELNTLITTVADFQLRHYTFSKYFKELFADLTEIGEDKYNADGMGIPYYTLFSTTYFHRLNCDKFKVFYEAVYNWEKMYAVNVVVRGAFEVSAESWFKPGLPFIASNSTEDLQKIEGTCVILDSTFDGSQIPFMKDLAGVSFNLISTHQKPSNSKTTILLRAVSVKFKRIEFVGYLDQRSISEIFDSRFGLHHGSKDMEAFINLGKVNSATNALHGRSGVKEIILKAQQVIGLHFEYDPEEPKVSDNLVDLKEFVETLKKIRGNVNQVMLGCMLSMKGGVILGGNDTVLLTLCEYVVLDVDMLYEILAMNPNQNKENYNEIENQYLEDIFPTSYLSKYDTEVYELFESFQNFRYVVRNSSPNVTVYLRLRWPTSSHADKINESTRIFLLFWKYANEFLSGVNFPYFVYQALDEETSANFNKGLKYGWWRELDGNKIIEKETEFLTMNSTKNVKNQTEFSSSILSQALSMSLMAILAVLLFIAVLIIHLRSKPPMLSQEEERRFRYGGIASTKSEAEGLVMDAMYNENFEIKKKDFKLQSCIAIGNGQYGMVYKTIMPRFGREVAVKLPNTNDPSLTVSAIKCLLSEIKIMSYVGEHPNIIKLLGAYTKEIRKGTLYVVTEYCELGSLLSYLRELKKGNLETVSLYELHRFCQEICCGMDYVSGKKLIHGDLAARNVLLNKNRTCKISDFGLSRKLEKYDVYRKKGEEPLPWRWMAPESLQSLEFTTKSDVWSCGVTFWEIYSLGECPYPGLLWNNEFTQMLIATGFRLSAPKLVTGEIYDKLSSCWNINAVLRPSFNELTEFFRSRKRTEYLNA